MDPYQQLDDYRGRVADVTEKAAEAKAGLQRISGTVTSNNGAVTVTVNVSGALSDLSFGAKADQISKEELASLVVATAQRAQKQAAQQIESVMAPVIGDSSEAMRFLKEQMPEPDIEDEPPSDDRSAGQRHRQPPPDDDEWFGGSVLR